MIKFRCSICDKKIGVPDEYAGKQVACPECSQPAVVPELAAPDEPVLGAPPDDGIWSDDVLAASSPSASATAQVTADAPGPVTCPSCGAALDAGDALCRQCGQSLQPAVAVTAARPGMSRFGLAVAGSCAGAVLGGFVWALIVRFTGYEIGWVAWGVGVLAGLGAATLTPERSVRLAVVAGAMAALGLIVGKLFIFAWITPADVLEDPVGQAIEEQIVAAALADPAAAFYVICNDLVNRGELDEQLLDPVTASFAAENQDDFPDDVRAERDKIMMMLDPWTDDEIEAFVRAAIRRDMVAAIESGKSETPMLERITDSLSPWDALWGFFAIGTACKLAIAGSKE